MTTWVIRSRTYRLFVAAGAVGVFAITGAPSAAANPVAVCTSHVVDGVEVDDCVGNPNADSVTDVPDVWVKLDLRIGFGI
jgi:hypothetical protein